MPYSDTYLYSPLSIKTVKDNRSLLLQFILSEIFHAMDANKKEDPLEFVFSSPACFFPYDWSYEVGCLNKIAEHAQLMPHAFPKLQQAVDSFTQTLHETLSNVVKNKKKNDPIPHEGLMEQLNTLYVHLEPFLIVCKDCENLLLFLIKNNNEVAELNKPHNLSSLLKKMFPEGIDGISDRLKTEYKNRSFHSFLPEIDRLISHYES